MFVQKLFEKKSGKTLLYSATGKRNKNKNKYKNNQINRNFG